VGDRPDSGGEGGGEETIPREVEEKTGGRRGHQKHKPGAHSLGGSRNKELSLGEGKQRRNAANCKLWAGQGRRIVGNPSALGVKRRKKTWTLPHMVKKKWGKRKAAKGLAAPQSERMI